MCDSLKKQFDDTKKNTIIDKSLSTNTTNTYIPPRIIISSKISRKDLTHNNVEETEAQEIEKFVDDKVDDFFQHLSKQVQDKIKQYREDKDYLKLKPLLDAKKTNNNFVSEFLQVRNRFEAEFAANTRIYHQSACSQSLVNGEKIRHLNNNKEYKLQSSSADKYVAMLDSHKNSRANKAASKYFSLQNRNWVPGAEMTKIKVNSNSQSSDSAAGSTENEKLLNNKNSAVNNNQETKIREIKEQKTGAMYTFAYNTTSSVRKKTKSKKKSFIEDFAEFRDKLGVIPKKKKKVQEENSHLYNVEIKEGGEVSCSSTVMGKKESTKISNRIITPFSGFKTSFFSNFNPTETLVNSEKSNKKQDNTKHDITANWVKGGVIERENFIDSKVIWQQKQSPESLCGNASPSWFLQSSEKSPKEKTELKNDYSSGYTPDVQNRLFQNHSAVTSVEYSKKSVLITQTKVTKFTLFPSHQVDLFY